MADELRWLGESEEDKAIERQKRRDWRSCVFWLESLGNAEDEHTAGWMRAVAAGSPMNITIFRRIEAAMKRWGEFRRGESND